MTKLLSLVVYLASCCLLISCVGQLPVYHKRFQPPPAGTCQNLDLGEGESHYGKLIKPTKEEEDFIQKIKRDGPQDLQVSPRLVRLSRLVQELKFKGCDTSEPELQSKLYSHVGLYSHINQMRSSWHYYYTPIEPMWNIAKKKIVNFDTSHEHLFFGLTTKETWSAGSAVHSFTYKADLELKPSPRSIKNKMKYEGKALGANSAMGFFVTLPNGSVQNCSFQRESKEPHPLINCIRHPEDHQIVEAEFTCGKPGQYQVEFTVNHFKKGPTPAVNFRVWCGQAPPRLISGQPLLKEKVATDPKEGEQDFVDWINKARSKASLPTLTYNEKLSKIARDYSKLRLKTKCAGHRCGGTNLRDRVRQGKGPAALKLGENAASNRTLAIAHQSLMNSPAHRSGTYSKWSTQLGVGIAVKSFPNGESKYYVTELYQSEPFEDQTIEHCKQFVKARLKEKAPDLVYSETFSKAAQVLIEEYANLNEITKETTQKLKAIAKTPLAYTYYYGLSSFGYLNFKSILHTLKTREATQVGIGCAQSERGNKKQWYILFRYDKKKPTKEKCETYYAKKLKKQLPHLKRTDKLNGLGKQVSQMITESKATPDKKEQSNNVTKKLKKFARSEGFHYSYSKGRSTPFRIPLDFHINTLKKWNADQFGVTCLKNPATNKWQFITTTNETPTTKKRCETYLRESLKQRYRSMNHSVKMARISSSIAKELKKTSKLKAEEKTKIFQQRFGDTLYFDWSNIAKPQTINLDKLKDALSAANSNEFGVSCQNNQPDQTKQSDWTVVIHYNHNQMNPSQCETYFTKKLSSDEFKLELNHRMAKVSNQVIKLWIEEKLSSSEIQSKLKENNLEGIHYHSWQGSLPSKLDFKALKTNINQQKATEFAVSCQSMTKADKQQLAVIIHYR